MTLRGTSRPSATTLLPPGRLSKNGRDTALVRAQPSSPAARAIRLITRKKIPARSCLLPDFGIWITYREGVPPPHWAVQSEARRVLHAPNVTHTQPQASLSHLPQGP